MMGEKSPDGWTIVKFVDLVSQEPDSMKRGPFGSAIKKSFFVPHGFKVYEQQNAIKNDSNLGTYYIDEDKYQELERFKVCAGDYIVSCSGTIGKITKLPKGCKSGIINQALLKIRLNHEIISSKYFLYLFRSYGFQAKVLKDTRGSGMQNLASVNDIKNLDVIIPPLNEQKRIVSKIEALFSELDDGIESLKTARVQLNIYRRAVLKHALEGKLTEGWREENKDKFEPTEKLLGRIKSEREQHYAQKLESWNQAVKAWEASGKEGKNPARPQKIKPTLPITSEELELLPSLPREWLYVRLSQIATIGSGMSVSKNRKVSDPIEVPYLRVANVQRGKLLLSEMKTMIIEKEKLEELKLKQWDVLFNEGGDRDKLGRGWIWENQINPCITQNHVFRASSVLATKMHAKFISHWGNTFGQYYFDKGGKQTTNLASINKTVLSNFPVPLCSEAEQEEIISQLDSIMSLIDESELEIEINLQKSEALRQSILKKAFSGQLVPQDPADEPASILLERIKAEKESNKKKRKAA